MMQPLDRPTWTTGMHDRLQRLGTRWVFLAGSRRRREARPSDLVAAALRKADPLVASQVDRETLVDQAVQADLFRGLLEGEPRGTKPGYGSRLRRGPQAAPLNGASGCRSCRCGKR